MKHSSFFSESNCVWLKGNVHCHTTNSDGHLSPEEVIRAYRNHGFDWLIITDHNTYTDVSQYSQPDFLLMNGIELTSGWQPRIHINVFWDENLAPYQPGEHVRLSTPEQTVAELRRLREAGCFLTLNHPHWSLLEPGDLDCSQFDAVEVFNYSTFRFDNMGLGTIYWDQMLRRGHKLFATASDDNHNGAPIDSIGCDSFGGFTVIKARERSRRGILEALFAGSFYASAGPAIYDFYIEDSIATLKCSPCSRIWFSVDGCNLKTKVGSYLTQYSIPLDKVHGSYIRAECMNAAGQTAYTNPLYL